MIVSTEHVGARLAGVGAAPARHEAAAKAAAIDSGAFIVFAELITKVVKSAGADFHLTTPEAHHGGASAKAGRWGGSEEDDSIAAWDQPHTPMLAARRSNDEILRLVVKSFSCLLNDEPEHSPLHGGREPLIAMRVRNVAGEEDGVASDCTSDWYKLAVGSDIYLLHTVLFCKGPSSGFIKAADWHQMRWSYCQGSVAFDCNRYEIDGILQSLEAAPSISFYMRDIAVKPQKAERSLAVICGEAPCAAEGEGSSFLKRTLLQCMPASRAAAASTSSKAAAFSPPHLGTDDMVNVVKSTIFSTEYLRWTYITKWYRSNANICSKEYEEQLLAAYGIEADSSLSLGGGEGGDYPSGGHIFLGRVFLAPSPQGERFINTLIIDKAGLKKEKGARRTNILFCHGFGAGLAMYNRNLKVLAETVPNARIYAIDWLGMGRSGRPPFPKYTGTNDEACLREALSFFLDSLEEWRAAQEDLDEVYIVAHSMGGYLATHYALRYPARVRKLILVGPMGVNEQSQEQVGYFATGGQISWLHSLLWNANLTPQQMIRCTGPLGARMLRKYILTHILPKEATEKSRDKEHRALAHYLYEISRHCPSGEYAIAAFLRPGAWAKEPLSHVMGALACPTIFIYGDHDWTNVQYAQRALSNLSVPGRVHTMTGLGHFCFAEDPEAFNRIVADEVSLSSREDSSA